MAPAAQKATDPIQQLFVDKINDYATKKAKAGGLVVRFRAKLSYFCNISAFSSFEMTLAQIFWQAEESLGLQMRFLTFSGSDV